MNQTQVCPECRVAKRFRSFVGKIQFIKTILKSCAPVTILSLLFLCSCATGNVIHPQLPATVAMNKDAGRTQLIIVTLQLEDGQELPCIMDTGCFVTILDQSLEPKLGKRCNTDSATTFDGIHEVGVYTAPKLYLGGALLRHAGTNISTCDCKWLSTFSESVSKRGHLK
jgi:hypothetical protein